MESETLTERDYQFLEDFSETTPLSWNQWETLTKKEGYLIDEEEVQQQNVECQSNYYLQHLQSYTYVPDFKFN